MCLCSVRKNHRTQSFCKISTGSHLAPLTASLSSEVGFVTIKLCHTEKLQAKNFLRANVTFCYITLCR